METDIIKEYLIGLGFKVDTDSINQARQSMSNVEGTINKFANNNKENISSMQKFFKLFGGSIKDNLDIVSKVVPEAKAPLQQIISFAELMYKGINKVSKEFENINSDKLSESQKELEEAQVPISKLINSVKELNDNVNNIDIDSNVSETSDVVKDLIEKIEVTTQKLKEHPREIKETSKSMKDFSKISEEAKIPIAKLSTLVKRLNVSVNNLMKDIRNVRLHIDSQNLDTASSKIEDLDKKISNSNAVLKKLNQNGEGTSNKMHAFYEKAEKAKIPIEQLIDLTGKLNNGLGKIKFNKISNNSSSAAPEKLDKSNNTSLQLANTTNELQLLSKESENASNAVSLFSKEGSLFIEDFAGTALVQFESVKLLIAGVTQICATAWRTLSKLANEDLSYQKLATQLWTTKENAKEIDMALKTMGVSMQDLWLSPELLSQFNQLRKDSAELKLPKDYENNLKVVRNIAFEFKRLRQAGSLAFQWIGYYISKYAAGPLANIHEELNKFTNGALKVVPSIGKIIGTTLGIIFRLVLIIVETIGFVIRPIVKLFSFIGSLIGKIPKPIQDLIKLIVMLGFALSLGPLGVIMLIILALDDLFTFLKGGHSVIGSFFNYLKEKGTNAVDSIKNKFGKIKNALTDPINYIKNAWNDFWKSVGDYIDKIDIKFKAFEDKIKNSKIGQILSKVIPIVSDKVQNFDKDTSSSKGSYAASYIMPQTTNNRTNNSNVTNSSNTTNNFNVYGTNPTGTANAINNKLNTGIKTRNLQGVIA